MSESAHPPRFTAIGAAVYGLLREAEQLMDEGPLRGRAGLLQELLTGAPRTVAELARARRSSRQSVRRVAHDLVARGLAHFAPNPRHRRAPLLVASDAGREMARRDAAREVAQCNARGQTFDPGELRAAARLLRRLRSPTASAHTLEGTTY